MKKLLMSLSVVVLFFACTAVSAGAVSNDMVKVGLRYGSSALFSANLENAVGYGYEVGYYDEGREFQSLGYLDETTISMTAAGTIYMNSSGTYSASVPSGSYRTMGVWHGEVTGFRDFDEAADAARDYDGYPAWVNGEFVVRIGCVDSREEAEELLDDAGARGSAVRSSSSGVLVTVTGTTQVLFEFDGSGIWNLGVLPDGQGEESVTWFKGCRYLGGFEYPRTTGGNLSVVNVLDLEQYVRGVVPYEMPGTWPLEALKAQAVCARTFVCRETKHLASYGFDVCATVDCQVYSGMGNSTNSPTAATDRAVAETAGECVYYDGALIEAVYHSSDGGATEDAKNVWGGDVPYLQGKKDPYEAQTSIPNYNYTVTYTYDQLTWVLQNSGYSIGTVCDVYVAERSALGNVTKVVFTDTSGKRLTVTGQACSNAFYSTTLGKNVRSLRFTISGGSGEGSGTAGGYVVNGTTVLEDLSGAAVISGSGTLGTLKGGTYSAITSSGTETLAPSSGTASNSGSVPSGSGITITGTGYGHHVGMSQYGAKAMAEQGYDYLDILEFYYTDVTIK